MSHLRDIMQRLGARDSRPQGPAPDAAAAVADYERQLEGCTPAMLHYEWSWLEQHLETLELCLTQPGMPVACGDASKPTACRRTCGA